MKITYSHLLEKIILKMTMKLIEMTNGYLSIQLTV